MVRGMIVMCGGCGYSKYIDLSKSEDDVEKEVDQMISDGWRYVKAWNGYICDKCRKGGDPLYNTFFGKPKPESKLSSYVQLRWETMEQTAEFNRLEEMR